jgi:uncharacterized protein YjbJ (UPF0337 family)
MAEDIKNKVEQTVDKVAGAGTTDKIEGAVKQAVGKGKAAAGEATGNTELVTEGHAEQTEGILQKVVGNVK